MQEVALWLPQSATRRIDFLKPVSSYIVEHGTSEAESSHGNIRAVMLYPPGD